MNVFISWSQDISETIAQLLKKKFEYFFNGEIKFWVSSLDITAGNFFSTEIINALKDSDMGIVCLDKSNYRQSWLYFEAGFIYGNNYKNGTRSTPIIFPFIFDNTRIDLLGETPFGELQLKYYNKNNIKDMLNSINERYYEKYGKYIVATQFFNERFDSIWNTLDENVNTILQQSIQGGDYMLTEDNIVTRIKKYNFPNPIYGDVIEFSEGFETHNFYLFLLQNASKRLYIFGRKNRKLTDKSFEKELACFFNKNIDFRLLYLTPHSAMAQSGIAQELDDFNSKLIFSLKDFSNAIKKFSYKPEDFCRMYDEKRESEIIIADNVVFYKDLEYTKDGMPMHFTNSKFYVTSVNSILGSKYYQTFEQTWIKNEGNKVTDDFLQNLK